MKHVEDYIICTCGTNITTYVSGMVSDEDDLE